LKGFESWINQLKIKYPIDWTIGMVKHPPWLSLKLLEGEAKEKALVVANQLSRPHKITAVNQLKQMTFSRPLLVDKENFVKFIDLTDKYRNMSYQDYIPELKPLLENY